MCSFELVGVISTLACEECIKEHKEQRRCTGLISQPSALAHAPAGRGSVRLGEKNNKTTELAEHQDPAQVQQSKLQTVINGTEIGD